MIISEIIFFVAVALLILLLARRTNNGITGTLGTGLYRFGHAVIGFFQNIFQRNRSERKRIGVAPVQLSGDHQFWQEEPMNEKHELSSHFEEGDRLLKEKKYPEAEKFFLKSAANNPKDAKVYARLGLIYLQQKNYSDAIEALKVAVKLDKYNPSRHYNLALAYSGNKDVQKAIANVREAITLDPVTPKYRALLEQLLNG